ncbi:hypothetical protein BCV70DRAFT_97494 [Testicularia cyperi]|uniref:Uncharacterized protein n=1 Tax=Testicularia cyperi TaxID=1882483 RepID=A0A317XTE9_9BASI|nr:hypothetical protein BCV70DRAFT_97494 [Testicularia cyperi]
MSRTRAKYAGAQATESTLKGAKKRKLGSTRSSKVATQTRQSLEIEGEMGKGFPGAWSSFVYSHGRGRRLCSVSNEARERQLRPRFDMQSKYCSTLPCAVPACHLDSWLVGRRRLSNAARTRRRTLVLVGYPPTRFQTLCSQHTGHAWISRAKRSDLCTVDCSTLQRTAVSYAGAHHSRTL